MQTQKDYSDIRRNRVAIMNEVNLPTYTDLEFIKKEVSEFKKYYLKNIIGLL